MEELQTVKDTLKKEKGRNHAEINRLMSELDKERREHENELQEVTFALNKERKKYKDLSKEYEELVRYSSCMCICHLRKLALYTGGLHAHGL